MEEVSLLIEGEVFKVKKELLSEYSDYFRAMFSGSYIENDKQEIIIDVIDANSMRIILQYMHLGLIDLSEYTLSVIGELAMAANFLQITELVKQIEYVLNTGISVSNWMETMTIAQNLSLTKLEQLSATFGLLSFKSMNVEYISAIEKLHWYLSHPYLDVESELNVFKFGLQWISQRLSSEINADAILVILGCLDLNKLKLNEVGEMKELLKEYENSLAFKVVEYLYDLYLRGVEFLTTVIEREWADSSKKYSKGVHDQIMNLVRESRNRKGSKLVPSVPMWPINNENHHMYTFTEGKPLERWLEVAEKNVWGFNIVAWGPTRLVVVGGERGRGTGMFNKDVRVYDTLRKEWTQHGVQLPPRRHGGVGIIGDSLYIVGGVGGYRIVLDSVVIYDLIQRSYRKVAKFPDVLQNPAVCSHEDVLYAAGHRNIYRYEDSGDRDRWITAVETNVRNCYMTSFKGYIYCTQYYNYLMFRFRPNVYNDWEVVTSFASSPGYMCNLGNRLIVFTRNTCGVGTLSIEEYTDDDKKEIPKVLWTYPVEDMKINDISGSCTLVTEMPPLYPEVSNYSKVYLKRYSGPMQSEN